MKFTANKKLWNKLNIFAKASMVIGLFFVDLAFKLGGMEQEE